MIMVGSPPLSLPILNEPILTTKLSLLDASNIASSIPVAVIESELWPAVIVILLADTL